ncbi:MAG: adenylate kinase family protein [Candidatus Thermoplasmatota archaeon]
MLIALSGTPGTGKTAVSTVLKEKGYKVLSLYEIAVSNSLTCGTDKKRNTTLIDIAGIDEYIKKEYGESDDLIFVEGHASHLLESARYVIILRCHPKELKKRLKMKKWKIEKIKENVEAEILDIILCEAVDLHEEDRIFEIDTTDKTIDETVSSIQEIINNKFQPLTRYRIGGIDWSEEILKDI